MLSFQEVLKRLEAVKISDKIMRDESMWLLYKVPAYPDNTIHEVPCTLGVDDAKRIS